MGIHELPINQVVKEEKDNIKKIPRVLRYIYYDLPIFRVKDKRGSGLSLYKV